MKTLNEFLKEIEASKELQEELKALNDAAAAEAFLEKYDCSATAKELAESIKSKVNGGQGELSDEEASAASGGVWMDIGFGRIWIDETLPERKQDPILPDFKIEIIDDD